MKQRPIHCQTRFAKPRLRLTPVMAVCCVLGGASAWAQSDGWVQFPPRPKSALVEVKTAAVTTPSSVDRDVVSKPNDRDGWVRFSIRPAPAVQVPSSVQPAAEPAPVVAPVATQGPAASKAPTPAPIVAPSTVAAPSPVDTPAPLVVPAPRAAVVEVSTKDRILGFVFKGNTRIHDVQLLNAVKHLMGQPINTANVNKAADVINQLYRTQGLLATTELPSQDLTDGWVQINVLEARFTGAVVSDPSSQIKGDLPVALVQSAQPKGEVVSMDKLDKAALLLSELPGVQANVSLQPGAQVGETQAVVTVAEGKPIEVSVGMDNSGSRSTGEERVTARVTVNNPLKIGDAVGVQAMHSQGTDYQRLNYSLPVGDAGWRLGVNTSSMKYRLVSSEFKDLNANGPSKSTGVDLTIPLVRARDQSTSLQLALDKKSFHNEANSTVLSDFKTNSLSTYLENTTTDAVKGRETAMSAQWVTGNVDLTGSPNQAQDATTTQTAGHYNKFKLAGSVKQSVGPENTLVASAQVQYADKNLDGSEKIYLGGMQGVRAYPTNEAGGSLGNLLSLEWQRHMMLERQRMTLAGFYDVGHVTVNKNNNYNNASTQNKYGLSGYGLWLGGQVPSAQGLTTWRLVWSRRTGDNPGRNLSTGKDQDGTLVRDRWRFTINYAF